MTSTTARSVTSFTGSIGVNTHIMYTDGGYANYQSVISDLKYLGIDHVRDMVQNLQDPGWGGWHYDAVAKAGIKFDFFFQSGDTLATTMSRIDNFATNHPGSVISIEGPNEIDTWPVKSYAGLTGLSAAIAFQTDIYNAVKADPLLAGVPVANFSLSTGWSGYVYQTGNMSNIVDYGNIHSYFSQGEQPGSLVAPLMNAQSYMTPGKPMMISETGYNTAVNSSTGVDYLTQAKQTLNLLFDSYQAGVKQTYLYQLLDAYADPSNSDPEKHFGLFDINNTAKPAAVALHNLTTILADSGSGTVAPGALDVSLSGLPSQGHSLLLEKSSGVFDLVLWAEPKIWDPVAKHEISVASTNVSVDLGTLHASVNVYDPLSGTSALKSYGNTTKLTVAVSDHPIIVEIGQVSQQTTHSGPTVPKATTTTSLLQGLSTTHPTTHAHTAGPHIPANHAAGAHGHAFGSAALDFGFLSASQKALASEALLLREALIHEHGQILLPPTPPAGVLAAYSHLAALLQEHHTGLALHVADHLTF